MDLHTEAPAIEYRLPSLEESRDLYGLADGLLAEALDCLYNRHPSVHPVALLAHWSVALKTALAVVYGSVAARQLADRV